MRSMTGYGEAQQECDQRTVRIEIRSVNNRHLKVSTRLPEGYAAFESKFEALVRGLVRRGTVSLSFTVARHGAAEDFRLNEDVLAGYFEQLRSLQTRLGEMGEVSIDSLVMLPGVVESGRRVLDLEAEWPAVKAVAEEALAQLNQMRQQEGDALADDLASNLKLIASELDEIEQFAPESVKAYEQRLLDRISSLLKEHDLQVDPAAVIREVGIFADRVDIAEEVVRLRSHLQQFESIMVNEESSGRKLDFLIQELLRETNTIGSKANHAQVARHVVQIKTSIERLREMIQNVE